MENIISYITNNKDTLLGNNCLKIINITNDINKISSYEWDLTIKITYYNLNNEIFKKDFAIRILKQNKYLFKHNCNYYPFVFLDSLKCENITNDIIKMIKQEN